MTTGTQVDEHAPAKHADKQHGAGSAKSGAHGGGAHAPGHGHGGKHKKHKEHAHDGPPGVPPWLMSFGDMMTLFLCFFIMLVTMAQRQDAGLIARGLGPFVTALEYHGLEGALDGEQRLAAINRFRERFGLPPEVDALKEKTTELKDLNQLESMLGSALKPHDEIQQPAVAIFDPGSTQLSASARKYLDRLAETLRPQFGWLLVLDGHASQVARTIDDNDTWLALARAAAVRRYLIEEHGYVPARVEARAWPLEQQPTAPICSVTARLLAPAAVESH
jgi:chemotaxis protein MotB